MSQRYSGGIVTANPTAPTTTSASGVWTLEQQFQNVGNWPKSSAVAVSRSVRLRASASAYFSRTPASAGNQQKWTWSGWVKLGSFSANPNTLFDAQSGVSVGTPNFFLSFINNKIYAAQEVIQTSTTWAIVTNAVYRDPSAWYHIVLSIDTTQATSSNRVQLYVNGVLQTSLSTAVYPSQNYNTLINSVVAHNLGRSGTDGSSWNYADGYLTEVNFIDGQALDPSYFGFTDSTGIWQPSSYTGTYGTNGFYLNFSDNSSNTATTIGKDYSGNGNNWTPNNISVTAGVTYDSMLDVPVNYADGGNGRGNYAVLNPLAVTASNGTLSAGNLNVTTINTGGGNAYGSIAIPSSGKWYWEITPTSGMATAFGMLGVAAYSPSDSYAYYNASSLGYYNASGYKFIGNVGTAYGATYTDNDIIGVAVDVDSGTVTFYKNNTSQGAITYAAAGLFPFVCDANPSLSASFVANFGQRPFTYTPPTGFVALNTQNLPTPTISNGANYMAATTYTGTGATQTISNAVNGVSFQPDLVWAKARSSAESNRLIDSVRGATLVLYSNLTNAEATEATSLTAFGTSGFTLGSGSPNTSAVTYVGWQWKAGGTSSSNTNGSITSTVSAGATQGFSVVTYTGTGSNATVGHGLGVAPKMIVVKLRNVAGGSWGVYHASVGATGALFLDQTAATNTSATFWNNTAPTSSVFTIGTNGNINQAANFVAYCFAEIAGFSKFGGYTGNGSADGPFIYCGFRPRWVMIKSASTGGSAGYDWVIYDTSRILYNSSATNTSLAADVANAEGYNVITQPDILSNGFKLRDLNGTDNFSGQTYIFAAFAENPFKTSRAR